EARLVPRLSGLADPVSLVSPVHARTRVARARGRPSGARDRLHRRIRTGRILDRREGDLADRSRRGLLPRRSHCAAGRIVIGGTWVGGGEDGGGRAVPGALVLGRARLLRVGPDRGLCALRATARPAVPCLLLSPARSGGGHRVPRGATASAGVGDGCE